MAVKYKGNTCIMQQKIDYSLKNNGNESITCHFLLHFFLLSYPSAQQVNNSCRPISNSSWITLLTMPPTIAAFSKPILILFKHGAIPEDLFLQPNYSQTFIEMSSEFKYHLHRSKWYVKLRAHLNLYDQALKPYPHYEQVCTSLQQHPVPNVFFCPH